MSLKINVSAALGVIYLGALASVALAHSGATGIVKERMDGMLELGKALKALSAEAKNPSPSTSVVNQIGASIVAQSGERLAERFPEGSFPTVSEANPIIVDEMDKFLQLSTALQTLGVSLSIKKEFSPDELRETLAALGDNCKACHAEYRIEK